MVESLNLAIGATNEMLMLLSGVTCASALFATLLAAKPKLLEDHYETVASIMQQRCGLSFLHFRNAAVGYEGKLLFQNAGSSDTFPFKLDNVSGLANVEKVLIDSVDKPVLVDMALEYKFTGDLADETAAEAFKDVRLLLAEMKNSADHKAPLIFQFMMKDPLTLKTVLITSNFDLPLSKDKKSFNDS